MAIIARARARPTERLEKLKRWDDLLRFARSHQPPRWIFRGQKQHWPLRPTVGRGRPEAYEPARELQLFNEFRRLGGPMVDRLQVASEWDWLFVAQHHGLPTRLLDWTTNPLVAAFFACQPSPKGKRDGEIIAIEVGSVGILDQDAYEAGPFQVAKSKFVYPSAVAPRIASQKGLFSIHPEPSKNWILRNKTERWPIKSDDKASFLEFLFGFGIDAAMVMADLDGLSQNLSWRYNSGRPIQ